MTKKFKMTKEVRDIYIDEVEIFCYRIQALRDFGDVKKGDLGGYIQFEENLSHEGDCWVYDTSLMHGKNARVLDNAKLRGDSWVSDDAVARGEAIVENDSHLADKSIIAGQASISNHVHVVGIIKIIGDARVEGPIAMLGRFTLGDDTIICDDMEERYKVLS